MPTLPRLFAALSLLAVGCRQPVTPAPPRDVVARDAPHPPSPGDVPPPRASHGLAATLMSCSPAARVDGGAGWTLSLRFSLHNQAREALPLRADRIEVTADEDVRGDLSRPGAIEGPPTLAAGARAEMTLRPVFPPSASAPVSVTFAFDSIGGINHPISFPIPSAR